MRNIIFLDIDGVLAVYNKKTDAVEDVTIFDPGAVEHLNTIYEQVPNLEIVISSSWRLSNTLAELRDIFTKNGFKYSSCILDVTPRMYKFRRGQINGYSSAPRGVEIEAWIDDNLYDKTRVDYTVAYNYVIVDDDSDMLYNHRFHFVQTQTHKGLTAKEVRRILKILIPSET